MENKIITDRGPQIPPSLPHELPNKLPRKSLLSRIRSAGSRLETEISLPQGRFTVSERIPSSEFVSEAVRIKNTAQIPSPEKIDPTLLM
ncbi:MAG: hypothetical protein COT74_01055 [Bdellovibrionales bacterium CG10_big_fil_rev_8_21_14_0_10_45_34]|nr:MAG: hypothetical protein COT74_01055 [Bdellovibrionales bacterium CG10_big_fil_rev_8_21_14_0_10_45_34]